MVIHKLQIYFAFWVDIVTTKESHESLGWKISIFKEVDKVVLQHEQSQTNYDASPW
jgi:hypothetical protein